MVESLIVFESESVINSRNHSGFYGPLSFFSWTKLMRSSKNKSFSRTYTCCLTNLWFIDSTASGTIFPWICQRFQYQQSGKTYSIEVHANESGAIECLPAVRYVSFASCFDLTVTGVPWLWYSTLTQVTDTTNASESESVPSSPCSYPGSGRYIAPRTMRSKCRDYDNDCC